MIFKGDVTTWTLKNSLQHTTDPGAAEGISDPLWRGEHNDVDDKKADGEESPAQTEAVDTTSVHLDRLVWWCHCLLGATWSSITNTQLHTHRLFTVWGRNLAGVEAKVWGDLQQQGVEWPEATREVGCGERCPLPKRYFFEFSSSFYNNMHKTLYWLTSSRSQCITER